MYECIDVGFYECKDVWMCVCKFVVLCGCKHANMSYSVKIERNNQRNREFFCVLFAHKQIKPYLCRKYNHDRQEKRNHPVE